MVSRHQCVIYTELPERHLPALAALLVAKLNQNQRCLYLNSPAMVARLRSYLAAGGLDVENEVAKGALILSSSQDHLVNEEFHVDRMLAMLIDALHEAQSQGYSGLWASGDMNWEFGSAKNFMKLFEYECRLEELLRNNPRLSGICQYHLAVLPSHVVQDALHTHQSIYINETLSRINPYYIPNEMKMPRLKKFAAELKEMLQDLQLEASLKEMPKDSRDV